MTKKREKPLHLDMSFDEALKRFAQTIPQQLPKKKPKRKTATKRKTPAS
jgi:DNA primase